MATADQVIKIAAGEVGYKEKIYEGRPDWTKYSSDYGVNHVAWCMIFVWWCFKQANADNLLAGKYAHRTAYTPTQAANFKSAGRFFHNHPHKGDLIFFSFGGKRIDHVGIVERYTSTQVHTIEGNSSNGVFRRRYYHQNRVIKGYGRPKFSGTSTSTSNSTSSASKSSMPSTSDLIANLNKVASGTRYSASVSAYKASAEAIAKASKGLTNFTIANITPVKPVATLFTSRVKNGVTTLHYLSSSTNSLVESIDLSLERKGVPGKLSFSYLAKGIELKPGEPISFSWGGKKVFYGFVFTVDRESDGTRKVTCYDQRRYLKNKDTMSYKKKSATSVIKQISKNFKLRTSSSIPNTKYALTRIEDEQSLFDIIQTALDLTLLETGKLFTLDDDFGKLTIKEISTNRVDYLVCAADVEKWTVSQSIDSDVYNQVKVRLKNEGKKTKVYIQKSTALQNKWGVLQLTEEMDKGTAKQAAKRAKNLLDAHKTLGKTFRVEGAIGDVRVRAGVLIPVLLNEQGVDIKNWMVVDKVSHKFKDGEHTMSLDLIGAGFNG